MIAGAAAEMQMRSRYVTTVRTNANASTRVRTREPMPPNFTPASRPKDEAANIAVDADDRGAAGGSGRDARASTEAAHSVSLPPVRGVLSGPDQCRLRRAPDEPRARPVGDGV